VKELKEIGGDHLLEVIDITRPSGDQKIQ